MPKFRRKPIVVEASQWFPDKPIDGVDTQLKPDEEGAYSRAEWGLLHTLEGTMVVCPGDWIITGVKGEKYPCKSYIFELIYDPVENEDFGLDAEIDRSDDDDCL